MLTIIRKKWFLKIAEVYFADIYRDDISDVDMIIYLHSSKFRNGCKRLYTLHIDLTKDQETLFAELHKNTKRKIMRAKKTDELEVSINYSPTDEEIRAFSNFYNAFAKNKKIEKCNVSKMKVLQQKNVLVISVVKDKLNNPLCYHVYITDDRRARLLYSASHFRLTSEKAKSSLIGRANRYLHWIDIKSFKDKGLTIYDFGGLSLDEENEVLWNIDKFKMGFGGKVVKEYKFYFSKNFLSKLTLKIFRFIKAR